MKTSKSELFSKIEHFIAAINTETITADRRNTLQPLIDYIQQKQATWRKFDSILFVRIIPAEVTCRKFGHKRWLFILTSKTFIAIQEEPKIQLYIR